MSRTKRKNLFKLRPKRGDSIYVEGIFIPGQEPASWKDTRDKKPYHKPGKRFKKYKQGKRKMKEKTELINLIKKSNDEIPFSINPKSDTWDYN